jgi:hypothetical protein
MNGVFVSTHHKAVPNVVAAAGNRMVMAVGAPHIMKLPIILGSKVSNFYWVGMRRFF